MTISPAQLEQVVPGKLAAAARELMHACDKESKAHGTYQNHVVTPVSNGTIWHAGLAQSDAVAVLTIADLAFDTASMLMLAGSVALATLAVELDAAKRSAERIINSARNMPCFEVHMESGEIYYNPPPGSYSGPAAGGDGALAQADGMAAQYTALLKAAMRRAGRADDRCGRLLSRLSTADLPLSERNDPGLLARAWDVNTDAYTTMGHAHQLLRDLRIDAKKDLDAVDAKDYTPLQHLLSFLKGTVDFDPRSIQEGRPGELVGAIAILLIPIGGEAAGAANGTRALAALGKDAKAAEEAAQGAKGAEEAGKAAEAAGKGRAPAPGEAWSGSGKTTQQLIDAGRADGKGGVPRSVQEMDKHATGQRSEGNKFPPLKGNKDTKLDTAQQQLTEIVTNPETREVPIAGGKFKGGHYYVAPDGRGVAYDAAGNLKYFGEFTYPG